MVRRAKVGDPCPTCRDTLGGTLLPHCGSGEPYRHAGAKPPMHPHQCDDALRGGRPKGCAWLKCSECRHYGTPNTASWVQSPKGGVQA